MAYKAANVKRPKKRDPMEVPLGTGAADITRTRLHNRGRQLDALIEEQIGKLRNAQTTDSNN